MKVKAVLLCTVVLTTFAPLARANHAASARITINYDGHRLYGEIHSSVPKCEKRMVEIQVKKSGTWDADARWNAYETGKWRWSAEYEGTWRAVALKRPGCLEVASRSLRI